MGPKGRRAVLKYIRGKVPSDWKPSEGQELQEGYETFLCNATEFLGDEYANELWRPEFLVELLDAIGFQAEGAPCRTVMSVWSKGDPELFQQSMKQSSSEFDGQLLLVEGMDGLRQFKTDDTFWAKITFAAYPGVEVAPPFTILTLDPASNWDYTEKHPWYYCLWGAPICVYSLCSRNQWMPNVIAIRSDQMHLFPILRDVPEIPVDDMYYVLYHEFDAHVEPPKPYKEWQPR